MWNRRAANASKQAIAILLFLSVTISLTPLSANSAQKIVPGSSCKSEKSQKTFANKKYTCIKKNGKLVWVKSSAKSHNKQSIPSAPNASSVAAAEKPFSNPFPDSFHRNQLVDAALANFDKYIKSNSFQSSYRLVIDPNFAEGSASLSSFVSKIYAALPFPSDYPKTVLVITENGNFAEPIIKNMGFNRDDVNMATGGPCFNCAGYGWGVVQSGLDHGAPHEVFHIWQRAAYKRASNNGPDPRNQDNPPNWWDEGTADFFGYAMLSKFSQKYRYPNFPPGKYSPLVNYITRDFDTNGSYLMGRIASEYIVASVGMEKFMQVFYNVGQGQTFPEAFENAVGITLKDFYIKFDRNLWQMQG